MLVCKRGIERPETEQTAGETNGQDSGLGQGGPVFVPRRKPSALAETLLLHAASGTDRMAAHGEEGFVARPWG